MFSYQKLEVYNKAFLQNQIIHRALKNSKNVPVYVRNQLGRASLSIMLNIAEGSGKFSPKDRRNYYVTARGSVFECSSLVAFLKDEGEISELQCTALLEVYEEISRM